MKFTRLVAFALLLLSFAASAACDVSPETSEALFQKEGGGRVVWHDTEYEHAVVCNKEGQLVVGYRNKEAVTMNRNSIGLCGEGELFWSDYQTALQQGWTADKAKAAMATLKDSLK